MLSSGFRRTSVTMKPRSGTESLTVRGTVEGEGRNSVRYLAGRRTEIHEIAFVPLLQK